LPRPPLAALLVVNVFQTRFLLAPGQHALERRRKRLPLL